MRSLFGNLKRLQAVGENQIMPINGCAAYAMYNERVGINEVLQTLRQGGFEKEDICLMLSRQHPLTTIMREANQSAFSKPDSSVANAGLIGWLSEFGAVVIPTFGFFIRSRAFFHALVVEQDSIGSCGRRGTLSGLGFAEREARRFEDELQQSGVLLYVTCPEDARSQWALELLRATGAEESGLLQSEMALAAAAV